MNAVDAPRSESPFAAPTLDRDTFRELAEFIHRQSGISLKPGKEALVLARLGGRMRELEMTQVGDYLRHVRADDTGQELELLLNSISTNVTEFFRHGEHFDLLADRFREWVGQGQKRFRFWSGACSTGEEPYSLAMKLLDASPPPSLDIKILATDISTRALSQAVKGVYRALDLESLPPTLRSRHVRPASPPAPGMLAMGPAPRSMITFRQINLSRLPLAMRGPFDAIFFRNVMIYFDNALRQRLLDEITRVLRPGGLLFIGQSESLTGLSVPGMKTLQPSVYEAVSGERRARPSQLRLTQARDSGVEHVIGIAEMTISGREGDVLTTHGLGSCLGVSLYDPHLRLGALLHAQLPLESLCPDRRDNPFLFVDAGLIATLGELFARGAKKERLVVKVAGGASMVGCADIGQKNWRVLQKLLGKNAIPIAASQVGASIPRTMSLRIADGVTTVRSPEAESAL